MNILRTLSGRKKTEEETRQPDTPTQNMVLGALQPRPFPDGRNPKHVYAGTVSHGVVQRRRAANKVARASRKRNRHG